MSETLLREKLAEIDRLRDLADQGEEMRGRWADHNTQVVESLTIKRRIIVNKRVTEELVMSREEAELFRDWLLLRVGQLRLRADELAEELTTPVGRTL